MFYYLRMFIAFWQEARIFGTPGPAGPWVVFRLRFGAGVCVLAAFWGLRFELRLRLRFGPAKVGKPKHNWTRQTFEIAWRVARNQNPALLGQFFIGTAEQYQIIEELANLR